MQVTISRSGRMFDSQVEGNEFYSSENIFCTSGPSLRRHFSRFTEVKFISSDSSDVRSTDRSLIVSSGVSDSYGYFVKSDVTYEILAVSSSNWKWRKWAAGMFPSGSYSDEIAFSTNRVILEHGITVTFSSASGKLKDDIWRFDALTESSYVSKGRFLSSEAIACPLSPSDPSVTDVSPELEGSQQEVKISLRGDNCFSEVTFTDSNGRRSVTGDAKTLSDVTEGLNFTEDIKIYPEGYFSGPEDYTFEIRMTDSINFKWRKYRVGDSVCKMDNESGPWCEFKRTGTVSVEHSVLLEHGVYVRFASLKGKKANDRWNFDAFTFWSTTFSPVSFAGSDVATSDDSLMYVEGTFTGFRDTIFEVEIMNDTDKYRWRNFTSTRDGASVAWSETHVISNKAVELHDGLSVYWLTLQGKTAGDRWSFTAFSGHLISWLYKSYVGDAIAAESNVVGDIRTPTINGTYTGNEAARLRIQIDGECQTSCSQFRWIKEYPYAPSPYEPVEWIGGVFSPLLLMENHDQKLTDGINITWLYTSGYKKGNQYTVQLVPMPTSILPVRPETEPSLRFSPFGLRSTYHDGSGTAPPRNSALSVEFDSGTTFKWRQDTKPFSASLPVEHEVRLGNTGVVLTFDTLSGFPSGARYVIPLRTHIPSVKSVSTAHNGARATSTISQPVAAFSNYANLPNQGSLLGDVRPWKRNTGNHSIYAYPTAGSGGGSSSAHVTGSSSERGTGLSNVINAVATQGYLIANYPTTFLKIRGEPSISAVLGERADELIVTGTYSGHSSYVYQIEPDADAATNYKWRKFPLGSSDADATPWSPKAINDGNPFDSGLTLAFSSAQYVASPSIRWTFTANRGHMFVHRDAGRAQWSEEKVITGQLQELASGVSIQFGQLSGYNPGDQFVISNRTIDAHGVFTGEEDAQFTIEFVERSSTESGFDYATFYPVTSDASGGAQDQMMVSGNYTGHTSYIYEVKVVNNGKFTWRKYLLGYRDGGGPYSPIHQSLSLSPVALDNGAYVSWGAIKGQELGDIWRFTAHAGDMFRWRKDNEEWSPPRMVTNVGLVEGDPKNVDDDKVANVDIRATGDYEGSHDAMIVIEILSGGESFRWKKHTYVQLSGSDEGTEDVMYDSRLMNLVGLGSWSTRINMLSIPVHIGEGIHIVFNSVSGYAHGNIYYIPVKVTRYHPLSHGVHLTFGSNSGYSPRDVWTLSATAAVAARGPLDGNTELIIKGDGFLPSSSLQCRLSDPRTLYTMVIPARYVSAKEIRCDTLAHPPDTIAEAIFQGSGDAALFTHGVFHGKQTTIFTIRMRTASTFQWRADSMESVDDIDIKWSDPRNIDAGVILTLGTESDTDGLRIEFPTNADYSAGDTWKVIAYSTDSVRSADRPDVQLGSIRPGIMKYVSVSNDGGISWSTEQHGLTRFLFSDIYVSPSGDDVTGDGTASLPYRTIQRGIHASLSPSFLRSRASAHLTHRTNRDDIIVSPGRYTGAGNTGLFTVGKMITVTAGQNGGVVIDCSLHAASDVYFGDAMQSAEGSGTVSLVGINVENCGAS